HPRQLGQGLQGSYPLRPAAASADPRRLSREDTSAARRSPDGPSRRAKPNVYEVEHRLLAGWSQALSIGALGSRSASPARTAGPAADGPRLAVRQCPPEQCPPPQPARPVAPAAVVVLRDPASR